MLSQIGDEITRYSVMCRAPALEIRVADDDDCSINGMLSRAQIDISTRMFVFRKHMAVPETYGCAASLNVTGVRAGFFCKKCDACEQSRRGHTTGATDRLS